MKKSLAVMAVNFRVSKLAYLITAILLASVLINTPINMAVGESDNYQPSPGSYLYLTVILFAVFVPALYFRKFMNLGVKKADYIKGCALTYGLLALAVSVANSLSYLFLDPLLVVPNKSYIWNLLDVFGWSQNGVFVAFFQQFAFLLLVAATAHLLTSIQGFWYGWVADVAIVAIISVFTPIPVLRGVLVGFFSLIIFTPNALLQIACCLVLSVVLFLLSIVPVKHKVV